MALPARKLTVYREADRLADLNDEQRIMIERRRTIVDAWRNLCADFKAAGMKMSDATELFLAKHQDLSKTTLYSWANRRDSDDPTDLLDGRLKAVRTAPKTISPDAWSLFKKLYLTIQQRSVTLCHQIVAAEAAKQNWSWPSVRSIQMHVKKELPPFHSDYFRLGEKEWHRRHAPKLRRDYEQYRSNEYWTGDFKHCDVFCRTSETDPTIVRPLLSAFMDLRSRMVVGHYLTMHENQDAVLIGFRDGVETVGVPRHVVIDNGKPYRARGISGGRPTLKRKIQDEDYVRSVFGGLNVAVHFSIPFNPDSKPIERWFLTMDMQFAATYESYCGGQKDDRFRAAHKLATDHPERCPTVEQLGQQLELYLAAYHATPHSGDGMRGLSPAKAFDLFDPIPKVVVPEGAMDLLLMRTVQPTKRDGKIKYPKISSEGVRWQGDYYGQGDPHLQRMQGQEVVLRVHPEDASYVVVCDLEGKPICRAYNNKRLYSGVTQADIGEGMRRRKAAKRLAKQVMQGATRAAMDDVTTAAIRARLDAGNKAIDQLMAATGTDDEIPTRNTQPLRSDWQGAIDNFNRRVTPPPPPPDAPRLEDLADSMDDDGIDNEPLVFDLDQIVDGLE